MVEEEEELSPPCKCLHRSNQSLDDFKPEESAAGIDPTQPGTPSIEENENLVLLGRRNNPPRTIVVALVAPSQVNNLKNPSSKSAKSTSTSGCTESRRRRPYAGGAAAITAIYRVTDPSCSCFNMLRNERLKLSGCAVVSKGILVVEGGINSIKKLLKLMARKDAKAESVTVIWQGRVERPIFGKFSLLHCNNDFAACKFFADHGALHYWNLAVKSINLDRSLMASDALMNM